MYLLPEVNLQLRPALLKLAPGTRIVSHDWDMGDWQPDETLTVDAPDKTIGREKKSRLHRWVVPADAGGLWCGAPSELQVQQKYQRLHATWRVGDRQWALQGRLDGRDLQLIGRGPDTWHGRVTAEGQLQLHRSGGTGGNETTVLQRAAGGRCP